MTSDSQIQCFLHDVKNADIIDFVPTEKNRKTRLSIGLTSFDQEEIVRNLIFDEYYSGPSVDKDSTRIGMVWVFTHNYKGIKLYIKLKEKLVIDNLSVIKCLSCHIENMH